MSIIMQRVNINMYICNKSLYGVIEKNIGSYATVILIINFAEDWKPHFKKLFLKYMCC